MGRRRVGPCLGGALAAVLTLLPAAAGAEVQEEHTRAPYPVHMQPSQSLREALNAATPIASDGQRFHGHTQWNVRWNFWWQSDATGRCRIGRVRTHLHTRVQLPELHARTAAQEAQFRRYIQALQAHEQGHVQFGRQAAQAIDQGIAALPAAPDCATLAQQANALGERLLAEEVAREKAYDRATRHGAAQGAQLE